MTWLRASRTVVDPGGTRWELYVTRTRTGSWNGMDVSDAEPLFHSRSADVFVLLLPVMMVLELVLGLLKLIALVPLSLVGVALRRPLRVEAITDDGDRTTHAWTVERPALDGVLDEIAAGLERGTITFPPAARYLGRTN